MDEQRRKLVRKHAHDRCEYCLIPQAATPYFTFHVEHVIAKQQAGEGDAPGLLALACNRCNAFKGPNLTSIDPESNTIVRLFHPRQDTWDDHFVLRGGEVIGLTSTGRATVRLLNMNAPHRIEVREEWLKHDQP